MAKVRLIDTADKFLLEIDGKEIPHVSTYEIIKSVMGYLMLKVVLSVNKVEEVVLSVNKVEELDIETDKGARVVKK